jgi:branched-chain amino acid transport system permease protein
LIGLFVIAAGFMGITPVLSTNRATDFMIFCISAMSFDLIYGYMGRLSFGHLLFLGR